MGHNLHLRKHIAVFGVDVKQVGVVRRIVAIADALPRHDYAIAILDGIDGGARTQPLVEQPVKISVSTPRPVSVEASEVPKKQLG